MLRELIDRLSKDQKIIVDSFSEAIQLENILKKDINFRAAEHSIKDRIITKKKWAELFFLSIPASKKYLLIDSFKEELIWQEVIKSNSSSLINLSHTSSLASSARHIIKLYNLNISDLRKNTLNPNINRFTYWLELFDEYLKKRNWITYDDIFPNLLSSGSLSSTELKNLIFFNSLQDNSLLLLKSQLKEIDKFNLIQLQPISKSKAFKVAFDKSSDEIDIAISWAVERIRNNKKLSIAIVIPDFMNNFQLKQIVSDSINKNIKSQNEIDLSYLSDLGVVSISNNQIIMTAFKTLEMFINSSDFSFFSRWLRSPYIDCPFIDINKRSLLEIELRDRLFTQINFIDSFQKAGLKEYIQTKNSDFSLFLSKAINYYLSLPKKQTPTNWAKCWLKLLGMMGWLHTINNSEREVVLLWEESIKNFSDLSLIVGEVSFKKGLSIFSSILNNKNYINSPSDKSIYIIDSIEEVSAGHDLIWITGLNNHCWPRQSSPNPLIPNSLQVELNLPSASPNISLEYSKKLMKRIESSAKEVVYSSSRIFLDIIGRPSPLLDNYPVLKLPNHFISGNSNRQNKKLIEQIYDKPPRFKKNKISHAISVLNYQSKFPLIAFLIGQLSCQLISPITKGISPSIRGIIVHRALELLYSDLDVSNKSFFSKDHIDKSIQKSLNESFGMAKDKLKVLYDLEKKRLELIISSLLLDEFHREKFKIYSTEKLNTIELFGINISCRSDRVDILDNKGLVVIDYKTGSLSNTNDWFKDRVENIQLPLYALIYKDNISGVLNINLNPSNNKYSGVLREDIKFPGIDKKFSKEQWGGVLSSWEDNISLLIKEFVSGDARVLSNKNELVNNYYLPVVRVNNKYEE